MMKNISKILAISFVALVFGISAKAQTTATSAAVSASATIVTPITITSDRNLAFGTIVPAAGVGSVTVDPLGARTYTGGVTGISSTVSSARFTVGGTANQAYTIAFPADNAIVLTSGANTMTLKTWTTDIPGTAGDLGAGASQTFQVGATLNVGAAQASGAYTGTFTVTVTYN